MLFLDSVELDILYPCRLELSAHGVIEAAGPSLARLLGRDIVDASFDEVFRIVTQRRGGHETFAKGMFRTPVVIETRGPEPLLLRGAVIDTALGRRHLLLGAVPDGNLASSARFRYGDFAPTDGAIDVLLAAQVRDASIEDARRLSERLVEAKAAEAAGHAKSRFLASMSHELRTPLNAIIGFTEIVIEDLADAGVEGATDDLARVLRAATHLLGLVNDVLDLAKIEAGKMSVHLQPVDFAPIAREIAATMEPLARKNGNRLIVDIAPDVGAGVSDAKRLRQCLLNLVGNAVKFTAGGEVQVSVTMERDGSGDVVVFAVRDTGIGMTEDEVSRLFKPFVQATTDTATTYGGTGLGLAITHESARLLGGGVSVESAPGAGSIFTFRTPHTVRGPTIELAVAESA